ncbi:cyclic lactone autoinducer peptide [Paenibacillus nasutitermitis]
MKKKAYNLLGAVIVSAASLFVFTGCYFFLHNPPIPQELRRKGV